MDSEEPRASQRFRRRAIERQTGRWLKDILVEKMAAHENHVGAVAAELGMTDANVRYHLREFDIPIPKPARRRDRPPTHPA